MSDVIRKIEALDQAIWLDSIKRSYLGKGEYLEQLIDSGSAWGLTSNPSIFAAAVAGATEYDSQVQPLRDADIDPATILWEVMKTDITAACIQFAPLYESSNGRHGYVSIEVDPSKAFDTEGTVEQGRELWKKINRPNLMIKVPGTEAGLAAITTLISEGINVNVTLLFSVERYRQVIDAHAAGLEARLANGEDLSHVASVASFFVSRVDGKIDALLPEGHELRGTIGIANARAAYGAFVEASAGERWTKLAEAGAMPQWPLWASTSTKDPSYPDTMYIDELVGPLTVNTVPENTLEAAIDHSPEPKDNLTGNIDDAAAKLAALAEIGIDLDQITTDLETDGVKKFIASFDDAVATVADAK